MSYDLAIWEGETPPNDHSAGVIYDAHMEVMELNDEDPPTPLIQLFMERLLEHLPDESGAWSSAPAIESASGSVAYLTFTWGQGIEAATFAARLASELGLICYDPQRERLRTD
ncbi:hypothetical protein GCM10022221_13240 [Actinocorallia aurea]